MDSRIRCISHLIWLIKQDLTSYLLCIFDMFWVSTAIGFVKNFITLHNSKILLSLHCFLNLQFQTFVNLVIGIFFFILNPIPFLKVTKLLVEVSGFKFSVMTEKNIFIYFLCKTYNPLKKVTSFPLFSFVYCLTWNTLFINLL